MATKVKVYQEDIQRIGNELQRLFEQLDNIENQISTNRGLIENSWKSAAATKYLTALDEQRQSIQKIRKEMMSNRDYTNSTAKKVVEIDKNIKSQLSKYRV